MSLHLGLSFAFYQMRLMAPIPQELYGFTLKPGRGRGGGACTVVITTVIEHPDPCPRGRMGRCLGLLQLLPEASLPIPPRSQRTCWNLHWGTGVSSPPGTTIRKSGVLSCGHQGTRFKINR